MDHNRVQETYLLEVCKGSLDIVLVVKTEAPERFNKQLKTVSMYIVQTVTVQVHDQLLSSASPEEERPHMSLILLQNGGGGLGAVHIPAGVLSHWHTRFEYTRHKYESNKHKSQPQTWPLATLTPGSQFVVRAQIAEYVRRCGP